MVHVVMDPVIMDPVIVPASAALAASAIHHLEYEHSDIPLSLSLF